MTDLQAKAFDIKATRAVRYRYVVVGLHESAMFECSVWTRHLRTVELEWAMKISDASQTENCEYFIVDVGPMKVVYDSRGKCYDSIPAGFPMGILFDDARYCARTLNAL